MLLASLFFSCEISISNEYLQDVTVKSEGLSCDGIKMVNYTGQINRTKFHYGEKVLFIYENMTGFVLQNNLAYPEMDIYVLNKKGDTIMAKPNLFFKDSKGYSEADLNLRSELIFAKPMLPSKEYIAMVNIRDKNSDTYYNWSKNFEIIHSPLINTKKDGLDYDIQYLYSKERDIGIIDNVIKRNEKIYLIIENLSGFDIDEYGSANIEASISLTSADGTLINKNDNLFPNLVSAKDLKDQLYASIQIASASGKKPVTCIFKMKDTKSGHSLETTFDLTVVE
ncbi:hypothetical protein [Kordia sp.]|uniref:hypothetical protein n=1 Tax=Kordia sp. TaxID=1965332 RepID=UPI003D6A10A8